MGSIKQMELEAKEADELLEGKAGLSVGVNTEKAHEADDDNIPAKPDSDARLEELQRKYDALEHKHDVLKGKEYAEVPRLHAELKVLREENASLKRLAEEAKTKAATETPKADMGELYKTLEAELGVAAVEAIKQVVKGNQGTTDLSPLHQKIEGYESKILKLEADQTRSTESVFVDKLTRLVPDWESVNSSKGWLAWLTGRVPNSRMTYQNALDEAHANRDHTVVAEIFSTFKKLQKAPTKNVASGASAEEWIEPGPASPASPTGEVKKTYTQSAVNKLYEDYKQGRITDKKWEAIEAEIDLAHEEGRIVPS